MKEYPSESAAGVAVLFGVIQVSVRARKVRERDEAYAGINADLLTDDWQFHKPPLIVCSNEVSG